MPTIGIVMSYKHRPGSLKEFQEWLGGQGAAMLAAACGSAEQYIGVYMVEGDPTYSIELRTETTDPDVLEEFDALNTDKFTRGQTAMKIMWRFLDQSVPPRIHLTRSLHEAVPRPR
ncbi:MAG TPA: hypothetical protein VM536_22105 [Chloroflexia bacterium]|nr:hypothetical protein [Chloroflexia bacterium]